MLKQTEKDAQVYWIKTARMKKHVIRVGKERMLQYIQDYEEKHGKRNWIVYAVPLNKLIETIG